MKDSQIHHVYQNLKQIHTDDVSQTKRKAFFKYHYSLSQCKGQLSEFNSQQVQINLHGDSNSVEIDLRNFRFHFGCNASVKFGIRISGSFSVDAKIPLIRVRLTPGLYNREKGLKSILFHLQESSVDINPKHDMKVRLSIHRCPGFIEDALKYLGIRIFNNKIRNSLNDALRKSVVKGIQRIAEKIDLQTLIPQTNVSLTYSFSKAPQITDSSIILYLDSYFYPINHDLINGKIPVPQRFTNDIMQQPQDKTSLSRLNSMLFYNSALINSGLHAAALSKRTYIIDNQFMRLFNSHEVINTTFLEQLIPEIGYYPNEEVQVKLFLVPDDNCNTATFGQSQITLDLKFQSEFLILRTQQEIMTLQINAQLKVKNLRGEEGDGKKSMMNVYGELENIELKSFEILHTSSAFTQETHNNMEMTIETFFILAQALINKDFMRYPYWIPVSVLDVVKVNFAKAFLSERFGLISAEISKV